MSASLARFILDNLSMKTDWRSRLYQFGGLYPRPLEPLSRGLSGPLAPASPRAGRPVQELSSAAGEPVQEHLYTAGARLRAGGPVQVDLWTDWQVAFMR